MDSTTHHCRACGLQLPPDAHHRRRYCDARCKRRAEARRERGKPEADPPATRQEFQALRDELAAAQDENRRLRSLVERINTTRRRWKKRAEYAAADMRRERERADRIETMWAQRARELSDEQVPLLAELEQARRTARHAEQRTADYDAVVAERDAATRYAHDLAASFTSDKNNVRQIVRDWDWLVAAYFRSRSAASLSERERAIRTRWSQFRRSGAQSTTHTPARGKNR